MKNFIIALYVFGACFTVLLVATILTAPKAQASTEVGVLFKSNHFSAKPYNEDNLGIYAIHSGYLIGVFENSHYDTTYLLGLAQPVYGPISISYGLVYGYGWDGGYADADTDRARVLPYILPAISISFGDAKLNTHYIGKGLAWSISYDFK